MSLPSFLALLGDEIEDPEEESTLLFSFCHPSTDLGMISPRSPAINITVAGRDFTITQSPTLLTSNRSEGTTGAVLWRITPLLAAWLSTPTNPLFTSNLLSSSSTILELGCGITGVLAMTLAPRVARYVATDQAYVFKGLRANLEANALSSNRTRSERKKVAARAEGGNVELLALDWETSEMGDLAGVLGLTNDVGRGIDAVVACDCIYNESLVEPFVRTCGEICRLGGKGGRDTVVVVAQQLRSYEVFERWVGEMWRGFRVWRVPDGVLSEGLREGSGFVVHVGVLRED